MRYEPIVTAFDAIVTLNHADPDFDDCRRPAVDILRTVCAVTRVARNDLCGPYRWKDFIRARFLAYYILRCHTSLSLPQIGALIGRRDHSTVMNGIAKVRAAPETFEPHLSAIYQRLDLKPPREVPFE